MKSILGIAALAGLTVSMGASAECSASICANVFVDQLYVNANTHLYVQTSGNETLANCVPHAGLFLVLNVNSNNFQEIYALLLAAQLSDKKVSIRISEGSNPCSISYVTMARQ